MAEIYIEKVTNSKGAKWVRTHAIDIEGGVLCFGPEHEPTMEKSTGAISCADCVSIIENCKKIQDSDLMPEYGNELFNKRLNTE